MSIVTGQHTQLFNCTRPQRDFVISPHGSFQRHLKGHEISRSLHNILQNWNQRRILKTRAIKAAKGVLKQLSQSDQLGCSLSSGGPPTGISAMVIGGPAANFESML